MKDLKRDEMLEEVKLEANVELFEEVEEIVTAAWTGCSSCCN